MRKLFGTDGVRGLANLAPMDSDSVLRLGRAAAHSLRRSKGRHRILIGKDTRISGYMLETALASGISSMGVDVLLVGPLPTPGVAFMTRSMRADAGVMISASHNRYEDNGIKFFGADGFKLADHTEQEIERLMEPGHLDELRADPALIGKAFRIDDAIGRYTVFLKACLERETKFDGLKVVLDCAHGAVYRVAPLVFSELGASIITIGDKPDGKNINDGVGSLYPEGICQLVKRHGADLGLAFDGDGDRLIACDEKGNVVDGDLILGILATDWEERGWLKSKAVVGTVMSNFGLERALRGRGITLHRTDVGDRYVLAEMQRKNLNLGGEQSGHLISLDHNTTGDGILTALLMLSAMIRVGKPLSSFQALMDKYPQLTISIPVVKKPPLDTIPRIQTALADANAAVKDKGRVLLRYSGTEPKVRVMVECDDQGSCEKIAQGLSTVLREELGG